MISNLLRWNDVLRTSRIFGPKVEIFSQFWVYLNITQNKWWIYHSLVISVQRYHSDKFKKMYWRIIVHIRFGHSLWSANQLPAQEVKGLRINEEWHIDKTDGN